jgi:hypothetical protein
MGIEIKEFVGHKPKNVKEQSEKKTVRDTAKKQKTSTTTRKSAKQK